MKKILFTQTDVIELLVEKGNPIGGAIVETLVWMKALHQLGYRILLFGYADDKRLLKPEFSWVEVVRGYNTSKGIRWFRWPFYRFPATFRSLKDAKPDFVYETTPWWTSYFTGLMCKILRIKFIMRLMNDNMLDSRFKKTNSKFERTLTYGAFKFADYILPQNRYQNSRLNEMYPGKKIKTFFPPFVIDRRYLNVKENPGGYIAWVANFRYQKNLKMLFEVASVLTEFQIKIAGTALPNMDEETQTYLKKLKELPNVEFVGTVGRDEILSFFSKSAYLLNTSRYEGFSNAFLEAFVTGTPILSTNTVNPDGIIDGFGLGVVYYSAEKLGDLLKSVTPDEYARLSSNCLEYVQAGHGHLNLGKQLIDFLEGTND